MSTVTVSKHTSILLLGKGATSSYMKQIVFGTNYQNVYETFGDSDLTTAYKHLSDLGCTSIFLMNLRYNSDYLTIAETLKQHDFAYIVPVSILISDKFDDPATERKLSYIEYLLEYIGDTNESVFVVTDKHASAYEDIDAYLGAMNTLSDDIEYNIRIPAHGENLVFVANNLYNYEMANVPLVASFCTNDASVYPSSDFGPAVFEIDEYEQVGNYAYFRNHEVRPTTVENLLNYKLSGPDKLVFVQRILKIIKRELDFYEFVGKQYTEYQRLAIQNKLQVYLSAMTGKYLCNFNIRSVTPYKDPEPMCIDVDSIFDVIPVNCLDKCTISKSVTVA